MLQAVDDDLVYADVDHTEIYAYGPLSYKGGIGAETYSIHILNYDSSYLKITEYTTK